jgi:hypothetical protein
MHDAAHLDDSSFFDFVGQSNPCVVFLSIHPLHPFNEALPQRLASSFDGMDVLIASLSLPQLVLSRSPILSFLQVAASDLPKLERWGCLPGYYLACDSQLLAWQSGLPAGADKTLLIGGALLGATCYAITRNLEVLGRSLRLSMDEASARRMADSFRHAFERHRREPREAPRARSTVTADDLSHAYQLLELSPDATDEDVNRAWRRLRAQHHPDHAHGDAREFERRTRLSRDLNHARDLILEQRARVRARAAE